VVPRDVPPGPPHGEAVLELPLDRLLQSAGDRRPGAAGGAVPMHRDASKKRSTARTVSGKMRFRFFKAIFKRFSFFTVQFIMITYLYILRTNQLSYIL
jgi:hypothetical protein